jgi:ADP-ribosyl-[dinitrogen reductase] hydrolase
LTKKDALLGCLLGEALGDSIGLWCEGMTPTRQRRFTTGPLQQRFFFGKGMISDDTEHALMTAQALIISAGDPDRFERSLAWRFRWWLAGIPAGIGLATLRAILKLWLGFPPSWSGVYSAGNGPAMRSAVLGVAFGHDPVRLRELVHRSTRLTHIDPKAEWSALAIALAAHHAATTAEELPIRFRDSLAEHLDARAHELLAFIDRAIQSAASQQPTEAFAESLGLHRGVTGYMYHTVPVVLQAWLRHPRDFREAITAIVRCGGDTDTTAAILGSILGSAMGKDGLPGDWLANLWEWPCGVSWIEQVATRLADVIERGEPLAAVPKNVPLLLLRKGLFAGIVLAHGFRRLLPPYG